MLFWQKPGKSFPVLVNVNVNSVALLVTSFVRFIVFVFVEVPLPEVVSVVRFVILTFAHPLLLPLDSYVDR